MKPTKQLVAGIWVGLGAAVFLGLAPAWGQTYSHARIVRLSFVEGDVTLQRTDIADWAEAPANTPIQEGFKLSTAEGAFAEVEFENGSTARVGQLSLLEFTQLALASDGSKIDCLTLPQGYATFHATPAGQDAYEVRTPIAALTPRGKALFRVDVDSSEERVEVFYGSLDVASSLGSWTLANNSVLELSPGTGQPEQLSEGITKDDWDNWVQERESREEAAQNTPAPGAYSSGAGDTFYGSSDLSYYGNWSYVPGYGYGWMPYVVAGWYPYSFGRWCWYPGFGYTWISFDPWGWLPYHYGGWSLIPGIGWVWFPGVLGPWSPGLVTWYMGPGWIGWMPRPYPANGGKTNPCAAGRPCGTAISSSSFQNGRVVRPGTILPVDLGSGRKIERPDISPEREAMLPGRIVRPPDGFARIEPVLKAARNINFGAPTTNREPTTSAPGAGVGSSRGVSRPAIGEFAQRAAPGPRFGIVYDAASGLYVNDPRTPSESTEATNDHSLRPLPTAPGTSGLRAAEPSSGTAPKAGPAATQHSPGSGWSHYSSTRPDSGSSPTSRVGGTRSGGHATTGNAPKGSGTMGAAPKSGGGSMAGASGGGGAGGGGGMGGGSHAGGGSSSGGGHHR